ncbi:MAG: DUF503 domain-containing protein [Bacillaceae bacterium]|nr:DUF503 domain-containing protein [Bacillaceae bacterium]
MIGYVEVDCMIYDTQSLKDKRSVIKKILHRLRHEFNISISEIDHHDLWQRTSLGIVTVSADKLYAEQLLQKVIEVLDSFPDLEVTTTHFEWL